MDAAAKSTGRAEGRGDPALRRRAGAIVRELQRARPDARVELEHRSPFELLMATILSAQCTDARVNQVTPGLFRAYPTPKEMAVAQPEAIERLIRSTGFFRAKTRAILGCSRALGEKHGGLVPRTMEELAALPGVGRKTANVVLGAAYGIPSGIVVDTHVARVARRLRLTRHDDPVRIERDLMSLVPRHSWIPFSIAMVLHGRYVCLARRPRCGECPLNRHCPSRDLADRPPLRRSRGRGRG
ncbi:MAG TPA: endonuclease III [Candidatus Cryosericum sp.]|nr:endonuclease III [Candidatus Cryosericum sp.]